MTESVSLPTAETGAVLDAQPERPFGGSPRSRRANAVRDTLMRSLVPVVLSLVVGGVLLLVLGDNPFTFYGNIWQYGIAQGSWEDSAMRAAPLLLIAVGLIVVFRANIWNLGYNGQFLIAAALITGVAPHLQSLPNSLSLLILFALAMGAAAAWTIIPALLKARYQTNEIITTLMMSFIGVGLANLLIKGPFQDPTVRIPETRVIPFDHMLPPIPGTRIHAGVLVALGVALLAHYILTRTSFGLRLHVLGANPRAAAHMGVDVRSLVVRSFLISGALVGAAAAADILGVWGFVRANWNPAYGDTVIPFVFLARLNPLAVIPFILFFAVLSTGGDLAATQANLSTDFLLVLVALILLFMTVIEFLGRRRDLGGSYLTPGLRNALRQPLIRRRASAAPTGEAGQ